MRKDDIPSQSLEVDLFRFQHISDSVCFVDKMMAFYYFDSSYIQNVNEIILQPKSLTNLRVALPWYADIKHHNWLKQSWDLEPVWPDWAIYWTLGNFSKPVATISLRKSRTFLGNSFIKNLFFKIAPKIDKYLDYFWKKICIQDLEK